MELGKCPHCEAAGEPANTSIDSEGHVVVLASSTAMGFFPFQDAQGRTHRHNPNQLRLPMSCEGGHSWVRRWYEPCWCGWPQSSEEGNVG